MKSVGLLGADENEFERLVDKTLKAHEVIKSLVAKGTYFFDYGNAFMKSVFDAGVTEISKNAVDNKEGLFGLVT